jgi:hypothetical protein
VDGLTPKGPFWPTGPSLIGLVLILSANITFGRKWSTCICGVQRGPGMPTCQFSRDEGRTWKNESQGPNCPAQ